MRKSILKLFFVLVCFSSLSACVAILDASTDEPITTDKRKRSFGEYIDDEKLETIVAVNIRKASPALDKESHLNVNSFKSIVLITGEVPTHLAKQQAGDAAKAIDRVRQVHNELVVGPNTSFKSRTMDNWYESKVKSRILTDYALDDDRINVVVEDNVVFLMGYVTQDEANRITELARTTKGIKKVVRVFEYINQ